MTTYAATTQTFWQKLAVRRAAARRGGRPARRWRAPVEADVRTQQSAAWETRRFVLDVELEGPGRERWTAVGVGRTLDDALAFARDSVPDGPGWKVVRWNDLYGE